MRLRSAQSADADESPSAPEQLSLQNFGAAIDAGTSEDFAGTAGTAGAADVEGTVGAASVDGLYLLYFICELEPEDIS